MLEQKLFYLFLTFSFCTCDLLVQNKSAFPPLKNRSNDHSFDEALHVLSKILLHPSFFKEYYWGMVKLQGKNKGDLQLVYSTWMLRFAKHFLLIDFLKRVRKIKWMYICVMKTNLHPKWSKQAYPVEDAGKSLVANVLPENWQRWRQGWHGAGISQTDAKEAEHFHEGQYKWQINMAGNTQYWLQGN